MILILQQFGMHKGQIKKRPQYFLNRLVEAAVKRPAGDGARQRIGRKGASIAAKHVAGKLIEQDDKSERAFGARFLRREFTARRGLVQRQKPRRNRPVEVFVLLEPSLRPRFAPERDNFG